jgi:hypothetical protein
MIAARTGFGLSDPRSQTTPALSEQAWLDWAVRDFNYQVEAFKAGATLGADWADWRLPLTAPGAPLDPAWPAPATGEETSVS